MVIKILIKYRYNQETLPFMKLQMINLETLLSMRALNKIKDNLHFSHTIVHLLNKFQMSIIMKIKIKIVNKWKINRRIFRMDLKRNLMTNLLNTRLLGMMKRV